MNILFLTGHPAQIHNFRILKNKLEGKGHVVFWMATEKDISKYLLNHFSIDYFAIKKPGKQFLSKAISLICNTYQCLKVIKRNRVDIIISRVSPYASLAGFLSRKTHITLADTESSGIYNTIFARFVTSIITPAAFQKKIRQDQIYFNGNIELFYLHPDIYKPFKKAEIEQLLGINTDEPYVVMRFVSWDAYHDKGLSGISRQNKLKAVKEFSKYARVLISSENQLETELEPYRIKIPPEQMHDVLNYAKLFFGESGTMASESAVLGTHAIYSNDSWLGYLIEERNHNLVSCFKTSNEDQFNAINMGIKLLRDPELKKKMKKNRANFLAQKINPVAFLTWFIENFPDSFRTMKENPDYQYNFR